jgi:hypothetical protein
MQLTLPEADTGNNLHANDANANLSWKEGRMKCLKRRILQAVSYLFMNDSIWVDMQSSHNCCLKDMMTDDHETSF